MLCFCSGGGRNQMPISNLKFALKHSCKTIAQIQQFHAQAITSGLFSLYPSSLLSHILHSFPFSSPPQNANGGFIYFTKIFNLIPNPSTFNYNDIIRAHTFLRSPHTALILFLEMRRRQIEPNSHTFNFVLKACGLLQNSNSLARVLHAQVTKFGFLDNVYVHSALSCIYVGSGDVDGAKGVFEESSFRNVVSYNVMLDGFVKAGEIDNARNLFDEMPSSLRDAISYNVMLDGLFKAGEDDRARELFEKMPCSLRDVVSYNAMIDGLSKGGEIGRATELFNEMPSSLRDITIYTAMIDGLFKAGEIDRARELFDEFPSSYRENNAVLWTAMLMGLAIHGHGRSALRYFSRMLENGVKPNGVTILAVLVGCNHSGLINDANRIFVEMESVYGVPREAKHYRCMVDTLARAGLIKEAREMIEAMSTGVNEVVWGALLGGCMKHGVVGEAEEAAEHLMRMKPEEGAVYSSLAHIYANSERWDDVVKVQRLKDSRRIKKIPGCSWIVLDGIKHEFLAGDGSHPCSKEIHLVLKGLHS